MKLSKISLIVAIAVVAILALSVSANAYTKEDLATYITSPHMVNGTQYKLTDADAVAAKEYIMNNDITDAQAAQAQNLVEQAISKAQSAGSLDQLSADTKTEITSLLQQAGDTVGATVNVNTNSKTISVVDKDTGTAVISGSYSSNGNGGLTVNANNPTGAATTGGASTSTGSSAGTASNGGAKTFVYTGANNAVYAVIALVAVVAVSTVLVKKAYAK